MKKILSVCFIGLSLGFMGCSNSESEEFKQLKDERDSLQEIAAQSLSKDSTINEFMKAVNEIEFNLATIKAKEGVIDLKSKEITETKKEQINNDVLCIYDLLTKNKAKLQEVKQQLQSSKNANSELKKFIASLEKQLIAKDSTIADMRAQLADMNLLIDTLFGHIDSLYFENGMKDEIIDYQRYQLNKAYYIIGTKNELVDYQVIDQKGGFVGLKRIKQLRSDFSRDKFIEINISEQKSFNIPCKKAEILTNHPSDSYKIYGEVDSLVITDVENFWSISKYLVIVVD